MVSVDNQCNAQLNMIIVIIIMSRKCSSLVYKYFLGQNHLLAQLAERTVTKNFYTMNKHLNKTVLLQFVWCLCVTLCGWAMLLLFKIPDNLFSFTTSTP